MSSNELEFPRGNEELADRIFARMRPELMALPANGLLNLRLNVVTVVTTVLGCVPRIRELRPEIVDELPRFDLRFLDELEDDAWVLRHAHTLYLACSRPPSCEPEMVEEATTLREQLLNDGNSMADRRIVDKTRLRNVSCLNGYRNLAVDLGILASVLKDSWPRIEGKTAVTPQDLSRAQLLSETFIRVAGRRDKKGDAVAIATLDRRRAFTLLSTAYTQVRRAVLYLRWQDGEGDRIAPSLFAGRRKTTGGKKTAKHSPVVENSEPANDAEAKSASRP